MFSSSGLGDELQALESEVSRLLNPDGGNMFDAAENRADALADQIKAALTELGETLREEEGHVEQLIAGTPAHDHGFGVRARCRHRLHDEETLR